MTHAKERKQRRQKRKRWQQRGGGGMAHVGGASGGSGDGGRGALTKLSPFWQTVIGIATLGIVVAAVVMIVWGIFFT